MAKHMTMQEFILLTRLQGFTCTVQVRKYYRIRCKGRKPTEETRNAVIIRKGDRSFSFTDEFSKNGYYRTLTRRLPNLDLVYKEIQERFKLNN